MKLLCFEIKKVISIVGIIFLAILLLYQPVQIIRYNSNIRRFSSDYYEITPEMEIVIKQQMEQRINDFNNSIKDVKIGQAIMLIDKNVSDYTNRKWEMYKNMYSKAIIDSNDVPFSIHFEELLTALNKDWYIPLLAIFVMVHVFAKEYSTDAIHVLVTTQRGNRRTAYTKLLLGLLTTIIVFTLIFVSKIILYEKLFATNICIQPIQTIKEFSDSPYKMNYINYISTLYLYKLLVIISICIFTAIIVIYLRSTVSSVVSSAVFVLIPLFFFSGNNIEYGLKDKILQFFPMSIYKVNWMFNDFYVFNIFNFPILKSNLLLIYLFVLITTFCVLFDISYRKVFEKPYRTFSFVMEWELAGIELKEKLSKYFTKKPSLIIAETKKFITRKETIITYMLTIVLSVIVAYIPAMKNYETVFDNNYLKYTKTLEGKADKEKINRAYDELKKAEDVIGLRKQITSGNILLSEEEYNEYIKAFDKYAKLHMSIVKTTSKIYQYEKAGRSDYLYFFYDSGWDSLFIGMINIFIATLVLTSIAGASYVNYEYLSNMRDIIITTPTANRRIIKNKLIPYGIFSVLIFLVIILCYYVYISFLYGLDYRSFPISSILYFMNVNANVSLLTYFVLICVFMCISIFAICQFTMFFSSAYTNTIIPLILGIVSSLTYGLLVNFIWVKSNALILLLIVLIAMISLSVVSCYFTSRMFYLKR